MRLRPMVVMETNELVSSDIVVKDKEASRNRQIKLANARKLVYI
ncbi:hypothetical protein BH09BAC4_BH09BAC4_51760 [soil metagenome]